jgi:SAM-dependent methyltransferase
MPSSMEYWKQRVLAHNDQTIKVREGFGGTEDFWRPFISLFTDDPHRTNDPVLNRILHEVSPDATVLDVGGGAGRYALPLALHCRHITVVEPSGAMIEALQKAAQEASIHNLTTIQSTWEDARDEAADVVLCASVVDGVAKVEPFIRKLELCAWKKVLILQSMVSPLAMIAPFWKAVHGDNRVLPPAAPELLSVLWEMDIYPDVQMIETPPRTPQNKEAALALLRQAIFIQPETDKDKRLQEAMHELIIETPAGLTMKGAGPRRIALISWGRNSG